MTWTRKAKIKKALPVPAELQDAMRKVVDLLAESQRNPDDVNIDFDDAIQFGKLCGGRDLANARPFLFYWHVGNRQRCTWAFMLHEFEIENIAEGSVSELHLFACNSPECQCASYDEEFPCFHCDTFTAT